MLSAGLSVKKASAALWINVSACRFKLWKLCGSAGICCFAQRTHFILLSEIMMGEEVEAAWQMTVSLETRPINDRSVTVALETRTRPTSGEPPGARTLLGQMTDQ